MSDMKEKVISWQDGEGSIVATYAGSGDGPLHLRSTTENEGLDRSKKLRVVTTDNAVSVQLTVSQPGKREAFVTADDTEYETSEGEIFAVLKQ